MVDPDTGLHLGRYRCANLQCGWQGLLPRQSRRLVPAPTPRVVPGVRRHLAELQVPWARAGSVLLVLTLTVLVGVQAARLLLGAPPVPAGVALQAGESHDGDPLPARHPWLRPVVLAATEGASAPGGAVAAPGAPASAPAMEAVEPLEMRRGCAWGKPGRNPYTGTVEQALLHARLPPEVVAEVGRKVRAHEVSDRLEVRTGRIHGVQHGREFDPQRVAMSFGRTLCLNSRVNFAPGHIERADLYEARDAQGRRHAVMVPDVCGNVSVLGERGERRRSLPLAGPAGGGAGSDDEWWALATVMAMDDGGTVPEPGTLVSVLLALAALGLVSARRRRRGRLPAVERNDLPI